MSQQDGMTPLIWNAFRGNSDCVKYLISKGADVNAHDKLGMTALIATAYFDSHGDYFKRKLESPVADERESNGYQAVGIATETGRQDCLRALIDAGADVNAKLNDGSTALTFAKGHSTIVAILKAADSK